MKSMAGFGGGATSLSVAGGGVGYDVEYNGFFTSNANSINASNSSYVTHSPSGSIGYHGGLSCFYDHASSRLYKAYPYPSRIAWNNGGSTYSGNASFYAINSSASVLSGWSSSGIGFNEGRGVTIAYLPDETAILICGQMNSTPAKKVHFFNHPSGSYIGYLFPSQSLNSNGQFDFVYSGTHILIKERGSRYLYGYDVPANTSAINNSSTMSAVLKWDLGSAFIYDTNQHSHSYGMAWGGGNRIYFGNTYGASQYLLTNNGLNGTASLVADYTGSGSYVSCQIDYKNRKLIIGGYGSGSFGGPFVVYGE